MGGWGSVSIMDYVYGGTADLASKSNFTSVGCSRAVLYFIWADGRLCYLIISVLSYSKVCEVSLKLGILIRLGVNQIFLLASDGEVSRESSSLFRYHICVCLSRYFHSNLPVPYFELVVIADFILVSLI